MFDNLLQLLVDIAISHPVEKVPKRLLESERLTSASYKAAAEREKARVLDCQEEMRMMARQIETGLPQRRNRSIDVATSLRIAGMEPAL